MHRRSFLATGAAFGTWAAAGGRVLAQEAVPDWLAALYRQALDAGERQVVYYPTGPGQEPLLEAFAQTFPEIELQYKYTLGAELAAILDTEEATGQRAIDVAQGGANVQLRLQANGRQDAWAFPEGSGIPAEVGFFGNEMFTNGRSIAGISYNTNRLKPEDIPQTLDEFFTPEWKGRVAIQKPTGAQTVDNSLTILREHGLVMPEQIAQLADFPIEAGNVAVLTAVAQGKYDIGLWNSSTALAPLVKQGAPLAKLAPPTIATAQNDVFCILKQCPHPNAARLLAGWLLSRPGQAYFPQAGVYSIYGDIPPPDFLPDLTGVDLKIANYDTFSDQARATREITVQYWP